MTKIKKLIDTVNEELCSAKEYAEEYLLYKARGNTAWARRFEEMANDELKHASYLHELIVKDIEELSAVYTPPQEMLDKWNSSHAEYVEKHAWIRQMLGM